MKGLLPFLLLTLCVLGCSKFGPDTNTTSNSNAANAKPSPAQIAKLVDLPATIGKSKDEIKRMISDTPRNEDPWLEYSLPDYELTFRFDKGKADYANFTFKPIAVGSSTIYGLDTAEQIGTMAGVDIKGKTPKATSELADTYEQEIGGKKVEVSFYKISGKFTSVMIDVD